MRSFFSSEVFAHRAISPALKLLFITVDQQHKPKPEVSWDTGRPAKTHGSCFCLEDTDVVAATNVCLSWLN